MDPDEILAKLVEGRQVHPHRHRPFTLPRRTVEIAGMIAEELNALF